MGQRGPAPTPTPILKARGSWRGKLNRKEPTPAGKSPPCPQWLGKDARAAWRTIAAILKQMKVLTEADGNALARYCTMLVRWKECERVIAEKGQTFERWTTDNEGDARLVAVDVRPEVKLAEQLADRLLRIEQQFGLTPSARARITIQEPDQAGDDVERFLAS